MHKGHLGCSHTANISEYIHYHQQTKVKEIPSHVKGKDFLQKLEQVKKKIYLQIAFQTK